MAKKPKEPIIPPDEFEAMLEKEGGHGKLPAETPYNEIPPPTPTRMIKLQVRSASPSVNEVPSETPLSTPLESVSLTPTSPVETAMDMVFPTEAHMSEPRPHPPLMDAFHMLRSDTRTGGVTRIVGRVTGVTTLANLQMHDVLLDEAIHSYKSTLAVSPESRSEMLQTLRERLNAWGLGKQQVDLFLRDMDHQVQQGPTP